MGYDAWLEAPYQQAPLDGIEEWAEEEGLDPTDRDTEERFREYLYDQAAEAAISRDEDRRAGF